MINTTNLENLTSSSDTKESSELENLLQDKQLTNIPQLGDLAKGKIISITKNVVHLDIDGLTTGVVRGRELYDESGECSNLKIGDQVEATVLELENENGEIELSFRYAGHQKAWDNLKELQEAGKIIDAKITDANKGGLIVKVGNVVGFLPVSQLSPEHYPRVQGGDKNKILDKLKSFVGIVIKSKVINADEANEKLIVSEKAAWEEEQQDVITELKTGDIVEGNVTAITDFGAFVKFNENLEGLVHISEIAWQRIDDPKDFLKVGQKVKAEIISIEGSKIFLSIKKLQTDPWQEVAKKYDIGQIVEGQVLKINPFGLFVELDTDIHGLAHISELSDKPIGHPNEVANIGDKLKFKIVSIEPNNHRLGLSLRSMKKKEAIKPIDDKITKDEKPAEPISTDKPLLSDKVVKDEKSKDTVVKE